MTTQRFFLAGLPGSGKTSYLAAFWVYANNKSCKQALEVKSYPDNADYLAALQRNWFEFDKVPRTSVGAAPTVELEMKRACDQQVFTLQIPDLSGESFDQIWSERHWTDEFQAIADKASGALLFIHPEDIEDGATLAQARDLTNLLATETALTGAREQEPADPFTPAPHDKNKAPTQIKLIENLQLLSEYASIQRPFRLGLVVSAWDLVASRDVEATPAGWLNARMPCLMQYLKANRDLFDVESFGVSAQGGDYEKPADGFFETTPYKRCKVVGASVRNQSDITTPLHWLLNL